MPVTFSRIMWPARLRHLIYITTSSLKMCLKEKGAKIEKHPCSFRPGLFFFFFVVVLLFLFLQGCAFSFIETFFLCGSKKIGTRGSSIHIFVFQTYRMYVCMYVATATPRFTVSATQTLSLRRRGNPCAIGNPAPPTRHSLPLFRAPDTTDRTDDSWKKVRNR